MNHGLRSMLVGSVIVMGLVWSSPSVAAHGRYRLTWRDDPATTMVIGWEQEGGQDPRVYWDTVDHGANPAAYPSSRAPDRVVDECGMSNHFVRLSGLAPDTAYYFVVADSSGSSARYWFKTAPDKMVPFTAVAGGDSRNNREPRRRGNETVAKLRPLFVLFGGDYTDSNNDVQWQEWFDDWQSATSPDGRMYPLVATRGNHDSNGVVEHLWDSPNADVYFGLTVAGGLGRFYTLNSEIAAGGDQSAWLAGDLIGHRCDVFRMAQYHRPMRPHTSGKVEGDDLYDAWAQLFHDEGMDLVIECDSHTVKRTWPVSPATDGADEGFARDDARGTVYIGEGCWGAPLREDDDAKSWTRAHGSFNEVNWLQFYPDRVEVRTIMTDDIGESGAVSDADPFAAPAGLPVWNAEGGSVLTVPARERDPRCGPPGNIITHDEVIGFGANWRYHDQGQDQGVAWRDAAFDDSSWPVGAGELGFGDMDEATLLKKSDPNYASYYFRTSFELPLAGGSIVAADLQALYDDGIAVWINGTQVFTQDVGDLAHSVYASATQAEATLKRQSIDVSALRDGHNVVAALVKQGSASSSDLSFDLALTLTLSKPPVPPDSGMGGMGGSAGGGGGASVAGGGVGGGPMAPETAGGTAPVVMEPPGARPSNGADSPTPVTPVTPAQGCACSIPRGGGTAPWLALAGLGLALWRRRGRSSSAS
jgi:hypothetical protein